MAALISCEFIYEIIVVAAANLGFEFFFKSERVETTQIEEVVVNVPN
jgi:hypothetical protein